ncbi:MAG TPA: hypothetical protein VJ650_16450 [Gemmatimonadaceae bacterium]|nr:hypothetical protein [Gemmatimonadaceae bacterium]
MAEPASRGRLTSLLWLLAGLMALTAAGIRYYRQDEISWPWAAAGLFCLALGIAAWKRAEVGSGPPTGRDRHPHA